jgi:hypothetical protein
MNDKCNTVKPVFDPDMDYIKLGEYSFWYKAHRDGFILNTRPTMQGSLWVPGALIQWLYNNGAVKLFVDSPALGSTSLAESLKFVPNVFDARPVENKPPQQPQTKTPDSVCNDPCCSANKEALLDLYDSGAAFIASILNDIGSSDRKFAKRIKKLRKAGLLP